MTLIDQRALSLWRGGLSLERRYSANRPGSSHSLWRGTLSLERRYSATRPESSHTHNGGTRYGSLNYVIEDELRLKP